MSEMKFKKEGPKSHKNHPSLSIHRAGEQNEARSQILVFNNWSIEHIRFQKLPQNASHLPFFLLCFVSQHFFFF
ncbi:hypothetical protein NC653_031037 [Populus alba x Populus x berolinensis]|uniref:Uncharacterized protein n=1 Tax=Populus alba x Populus x berolinensis TaxID=444605 RepID=A0AAD6Q0W6_9ROSI|nr:hypothetical protein NC653_031037 [Populus alba x Populus x berolinensis]